MSKHYQQRVIQKRVVHDRTEVGDHSALCMLKRVNNNIHTMDHLLPPPPSGDFVKYSLSSAAPPSGDELRVEALRAITPRCLERVQ